MIVSFARAGAWLLMQAAHTDTLLMRQVGSERGWFDTAAAIAGGVTSVAILVMAIALVPAAWYFRKSYQRVDALLDRVYGDLVPIVRHASSIADDVNYVTSSVRADMQKVNATIDEANDRLHAAMAVTEQRLNEFNALLDVVQQEAESMFVATASTMRGVRTGAASLHTDDDDEVPLPARSASEEFDDGNDDPDAPEEGTTRPRVRSRGRGYA